MAPTLTSIRLYPLDLGLPLEVTACAVERHGLARDRRWFVVDNDAKALSGRELTRLTLLRALPNADASLHLDAPGTSGIRIAVPDTHGERVETSLCVSPVAPLLADEDTNAWLTTYLGVSARLLYLDVECLRALHARYGSRRDGGEFDNAFPFGLMTEATLEHLESPSAAPAPRPSPNLVVAGIDETSAQSCRGVRIGELDFDVVVGQAQDPERPLAGARRAALAASRGRQLIARATGILNVGDPVTTIF